MDKYLTDRQVANRMANPSMTDGKTYHLLFDCGGSSTDSGDFDSALSDFNDFGGEIIEESQ